jgi:hypothetical protein
VYLIWRVVYCCLHVDVGANHAGPVSGVEFITNGCEFMVTKMSLSRQLRVLATSNAETQQRGCLFPAVLRGHSQFTLHESPHEFRAVFGCRRLRARARPAWTGLRMPFETALPAHTSVIVVACSV